MPILKLSATLVAFAAVVSGHTAAWTEKGMYCAWGNSTNPADRNQNNAMPVGPLWNLTQQDWWFQHDRGCDQAPPPEGEFLDIPAGSNFTVELAHNRAFTSLPAYNGSKMSDWPDGQEHPDDMSASPTAPQPGCVVDGALHTTNQSDAAGTAWAIAYESDLSKITLDSLVVFSVLEHTPWKRVATYQVPAAMPACPEDGCTCAWLWVPNACGQSNIYMQGFKCNITGATSKTPLAPAKAPTFCTDDQSKCVKGAKQMIVAYQAEGNNIDFQDRENGTPMYNDHCGFSSGAQDDIFMSSE